MSATAPLRVLLVDSDIDVRRAPALLLGAQIVGEADHLTERIILGAAQADILFIDWADIAPDGPQVLAHLRARYTPLQVIVLSTRPEDQTAALDAGADAFISKVDTPEYVLGTVRAVVGALNNEQVN
jgi:CheY-like chemotaxis protein